jgi:hypothetical protein
MLSPLSVSVGRVDTLGSIAHKMISIEETRITRPGCKGRNKTCLYILIIL